MSGQDIVPNGGGETTWPSDAVTMVWAEAGDGWAQPRVVTGMSRVSDAVAASVLAMVLSKDAGSWVLSSRGLTRGGDAEPEEWEDEEFE